MLKMFCFTNIVRLEVKLLAERWVNIGTTEACVTV